MRIATAFLASTFALATTIRAQNMEKSGGTLSELRPDTIALQDSSSNEPVRYLSSQTTLYVDDAGVPISSIDPLKAGVTVTVYYSKVGDQKVASRVVVHTSTTKPGLEVQQEPVRTAEKEE
jgi:archaellum component FlaG (FlaF/FlaG flagellin family)